MQTVDTPRLNTPMSGTRARHTATRAKPAHDMQTHGMPVRRTPTHGMQVRCTPTHGMPTLGSQIRDSLLTPATRRIRARG
jgi:hypothetical protein